MSKISLDSKHLVSFKPGLDSEKKLYQREQPCICREKKEMTWLVFSVIKHLLFAHSLTAHETLSLLSFCVSLSSKQAPEAKMLEFYFPENDHPTKVIFIFQFFRKLLSKTAIGESEVNSN